MKAAPRPMPKNMGRVTAIKRPKGVIGNRSPYPTVVEVTILHHRASSNPARSESAGSTAIISKEETNSRQT
jgi:hypothetical protein